MAGPPNYSGTYGGSVGMSSPRILLKRLREIMELEATAQERLDHVTEAIAANMVADVCSIYLRRVSDRFELFSTEGLNKEAVHKTKLEWGEGLVGLIGITGKPLSLTEAQEHPNFSFRPETGEEILHSFLGVPILRSGKVLGVLVIQNRAAREYSDEEREAVETIATVLAEVVATGDLLDEEETEIARNLLLRHEVVEGMPIVKGIVIGQAALHEPPAPLHKTFASNVAEEVSRLEVALQDLQKNVDDMIAANRELSSVSREVLDVYRLFAYDKGWSRRLNEAVRSGLSAESAVEQVQAENRKRMRQAADPYLRERLHDLDDLSRRLMRMLSGASDDEVLNLPDNAVLFADALGPAELLELDKEKLKAVVLGEGAETSHAAIVARSLGIPLIGRASEAIDIVHEGDQVIVDGKTGEINIRPPEETILAYQDKLFLATERQAAYLSERDLPAISIDGIEIELLMNAGLVVDMPHLHETGAAGVGLFRTELQFLIGPQLPTAKEQEELYRAILDGAGDKRIVFRTADLGSDKQADYMRLSSEANPAMGWRGLRMSIDREGLMRPQIRALIAASDGRPLDILLPLVTTSEEVRQARAIIDKELERRGRQGQSLPSEVRIGAMIEIPSAAWSVDRIARQVDFLSIGGNDLAQFFFAADRESEKLSGRYDPLHPSFLSFLKMIVEKAEAAGKPVCYCGEQAADPVMALALMAIGVRKLSVPASAVGRLRRLVRSSDIGTMKKWFDKALEEPGQSLREPIKQAAKRYINDPEGFALTK